MTGIPQPSRKLLMTKADKASVAAAVIFVLIGIVATVAMFSLIHVPYIFYTLPFVFIASALICLQHPAGRRKRFREFVTRGTAREVRVAYYVSNMRLSTQKYPVEDLIACYWDETRQEVVALKVETELPTCDISDQYPIGSVLWAYVSGSTSVPASKAYNNHLSHDDEVLAHIQILNAERNAVSFSSSVRF